MPARRQSVDSGAGDQRSQPPRSLSGSQSASGDGDKVALDPSARMSRGPPSAAARGSGRGRAKIRGKGRAAMSTARRTSAAGSETPRENSAGSDMSSSEDPDDVENGDPDPARDSTRPPRPISPELGLPALLAAAKEERPRSSSLSAISSRASSPEDAPAKLLIPTLPFFSLVENDSLSPLSDDTARGTSRNVDREPAAEVEGNPSTPVQTNLTELDAHDSLSELESSDDDTPLAARARQGASASGSRSLSTNSTPAPPGTENSGSLSPAPKRRGRPPGSKNRQARQSAPARTQRGGHTTRPGALAPPSRMSSSESATPAPGSAPARATRANVTLPPGYIWGVTSSRWPRKPRKGEETEENEEHELDSEVDELESDTLTEKGREIVEDELMEEALPLEAEDVVFEPAPKEEERDETPAAESVEAQAAAVLHALEGDLPQSEVMSREPSHEGSVDSMAIATTPKGKVKGKGKRGKKALPEPVERSKRRKLDGLDKETLEKLAAREAARMRFLGELEAELLQVEQHSHPLLDYTYARLREEKEQKLAQLRKYQEQREQELARSLEASRRASWRQWSDGKDRLRMELYLDNHRSLKSLLDEEKVFPFFRDHPLFVNNHDLPPTGYYRGPQRDPAFIPRALVHAGHYVEPPPVNTALQHEVWALAADEIEADLALFYDIEDVAPPPAASAPPPPANVPYALQQPLPPYHFEPTLNGGAFHSSVPTPLPDFPRPSFPPYGANVPPPPLASASAYTMPVVGTHAYAQHPQTQARPPPPTTQFVSAPYSAPFRPPPTSAKATPGPISSVPASPRRARPASPPRAVKLDSVQSAGPGPATAKAPALSNFAPGIAAIPTPRSPPRAQQPRVSYASTSPRQHQPAVRPMGSDGRMLSQYGGTSTLSSFPSSFSTRPSAPQPASAPASNAQASRSLPSLAAPVWPAYNTEPSAFRPSQQAPPPPQQSFKPTVTAAPATTGPKSGTWAPAPPVMPAPPQSNGVLKSWLPSARPPSHSSAPLPPIRQTLFPTSFPTGGLPPVAKHLSPPPPPAQPTSLAGQGDRIPAPVRSPQQPRPAFPSMQKHDPLPLPSWLRPNGAQDARSSAIAPGSLPGPKLPHELREAAEAKPTLKDGPGFPIGGAGFTGGAGAGIRKFQ